MDLFRAALGRMDDVSEALKEAAELDLDEKILGHMGAWDVKGLMRLVGEMAYKSLTIHQAMLVYGMGTGCRIRTLAEQGDKSAQFILETILN